jgi:hypothetical protein
MSSSEKQPKEIVKKSEEKNVDGSVSKPKFKRFEFRENKISLMEYNNMENYNSLFSDQSINSRSSIANNKLNIVPVNKEVFDEEFPPLTKTTLLQHTQNYLKKSNSIKDVDKKEVEDKITEENKNIHLEKHSMSNQQSNDLDFHKNTNDANKNTVEICKSNIEIELQEIQHELSESEVKIDDDDDPKNYVNKSLEFPTDSIITDNTTNYSSNYVYEYELHDNPKDDNLPYENPKHENSKCNQDHEHLQHKHEDSQCEKGNSNNEHSKHEHSQCENSKDEHSDHDCVNKEIDIDETIEVRITGKNYYEKSVSRHSHNSRSHTPINEDSEKSYKHSKNASSYSSKLSSTLEKKLNDLKEPAPDVEKDHKVVEELFNKIHDRNVMEKNQLSFKHEELENQLSSKHEEVKNQLSSKHEELENQLSSKHEEVKNQLSFKHEEVKKQLSFKHEEFEKQLSFKHEEFENQLSSKHEEVKNQLSFKHEEVKKQLSFKHEEFENQLSSKHEEVKNQLSSKHEEVKNQLSSKHEEVKNQLSSKHEEVKNQLSSKHEEFKHEVLKNNYPNNYNQTIIVDRKESLAILVEDNGEMKDVRLTEEEIKILENNNETSKCACKCVIL